MTVRRPTPPESSAAATGFDVDRRCAERVDALIRTTIRQTDLVGAPLTRARAIDVSDAGMRMLTRRRIPIETRVTIDMECEIPLRVHLGFDADSLVIDGPMHIHIVRVAGTVVRSQRLRSRLWEVAVQICTETSRFDELQLMQFYVEHLRGEQDSWTA